MNPKAVLADYQTNVQTYLYKFDFVHGSERFNKTFCEFIKDFILRGGKRIRPILINETYKIFSDKNLDEVFETSLFMEFVQGWLLMHDDIMDHDDMRRGGSTVHKMFEGISADYNFRDQKDFGNTFGILAGDYSGLMAFEILGKSKLSGEIIKKVLAFSARELQNVVFGQNLDIITSKRADYTDEDILKFFDLKTARYTFLIPCIAGAIMAEADQVHQDALEAYSIPVGIAFQIRDDILGLFGNEEETGKSNLGDIEEGKRTILVWKAYEQANEKQKKTLNKYYGKENLTKVQGEEFKQIIRQTGALAYAEKLCQKYVDRAKFELEKLPNHDSEGWQFLNWIADYMMSRDK
jgi:geranylgeranyl diphosphate synthase type I